MANKKLAMLQKGFLKHKLTIHVIGKKRFWNGIISGLLFSISIWMLFSYYREIARALTTLNGDLLVLPQYDDNLNDYFFATIAVLTGFGFTIWIWFGTKRLHSKRSL